MAKDCQVAYADMYTALEGDKSPDEYNKYLSDGLHLNEKGNEVAFAAIAQAISQQYPDLDPSKLAMQAPGWDQCQPDIKFIPLY